MFIMEELMNPYLRGLSISRQETGCGGRLVLVVAQTTYRQWLWGLDCRLVDIVIAENTHSESCELMSLRTLIILFYFRCKKWVHVLKRAHIVPAVIYDRMTEKKRQSMTSTRNLRLCEYHFKAECFMNPMDKGQYFFRPLQLEVYWILNSFVSISFY